MLAGLAVFLMTAPQAPAPWPGRVFLSKAQLVERKAALAAKVTETAKPSSAPAPTPPEPPPRLPKPARLGPVTVLKPDVMHGWEAYDDGAQRSYRIGEVSMTFSLDGDTAEEMATARGLRVTFRAPGVEPGAYHLPDSAPRATFGVGSLDPRRPGPQVLLVANTGGAHCCNALVLVTPDRGRWRMEFLTHLDGDPIETWPKDADGDGWPEIVTYDNGFLYAFCGYPCSFPPPIVYQLENGRIIDVSQRRAFRKIFQKQMEEMTPLCRRHVNAACASMVAASIRLGRRKQAWKVMLANHDPDDRGHFYRGCRVALTGGCPPGQDFVFEHFPDALTDILKLGGYPG